MPVAAFADYGEVVGDQRVYTIFHPVNCLHLSHLLNGQHEEEIYSRHSADSINFVAPTAHILVVDDNPVNLQVAKGLMESYEFKIDTAQNGIEAITMVQQREYDLVFMDHMMPEMDGVDATVAIRKLAGEYYQTLPIIALTANALVGTREMFIREGMNDFLAKPIELNKLAHTLVKWLPSSKVVKQQRQTAEKAGSEAAGLHIAGVNTAQGIASVGGSEESYLQILSAYHADGVQKYSSLPRRIEEKKIDTFRTEVHALKSTSATIGAQEVASQAAALEAAAQCNDTAFLHSHLGAFLDSLQGVLDSIRGILPGDPAPAPLTEGKAAGEVVYLEGALELLQDAIEFVNIGQIEESLFYLQEFTWPEKIAAELLAMQQHLTVFDYDGLLECVVRLKTVL